jgi:hypothetical protein
MKEASSVLDELISVGEQIRQAEVHVNELKRRRDDLIYEANEKHVIPIATICTALGVRRDTVVNGKLKAQARHLIALQLEDDDGAAA